MSAEQFQLMSIIGFACMAIFLIAAAIMFFTFDIPAVIGELSGKTAAKQVAQIRERNKRPTSRQNTINGYENMLANSGKTTEMLKKEKKPIIPGWTSTQPFSKNPVVADEGTALLDEGTALLDEGTALLSEETTMLDEGTVLLSDETMLLSEPEEVGTTLLGERTTLLTETESYNENFIIVQNVVVVHTNERI